MRTSSSTVQTKEKIMKTCLICSVGGSHQPIVKAIRDIKPDYTLFVCSQDDPESATKGSKTAIEGKGNLLKRRHEQEKPDLPNIPAQTELQPGSYEILEVPSDDLDQSYQKLNEKIDSLTLNNPYQYIVDYTGGTKTMSSALVLVAVDRSLQLNLIVGTRANHIKVTNGSEQSMMLDIQHIRYQRQLSQATALWQTTAYQQAAQQAQRIPLTAQNKTSRNTFIQVSNAFAAWYRFDHDTAYRILDQYRARLMPYFGEHIKVLGFLARAANPENTLKDTPWKLLDLWNNIQRKAGQSYYDDALARLYRLLEWTAQWIIEGQKGYKTADLPRSEIPEKIVLSQNSKGKWQAGLMASWQLARWAGQPEVEDFMQNQYNTMYDKIQKRNSSILAHGFEPIDRQTFADINDWATQQFLPLLLKLVSQQPYRITLSPDRFQLPDCYPEALIK